MLRRPGRAGIAHAQRMKENSAKIGAEVKEESLKQMREQLTVFQAKLEEFAKKYRKQIARDPEFRARFNEMCTKIGVDPLSSNKSFWSQLLGVNDFYYVLGVQVVEACIATRAADGGLVEIAELKQRLERKRGKQAQKISMF